MEIRLFLFLLEASGAPATNYHPANETISQLVVKSGVVSDTTTSEVARILK